MEKVQLFYILILSIIYSVFFFSIQKYIAIKFDIFDHPNNRKIHKSKTPITGGIGLYILISTIFLFGFFDKEFFDIKEILNIEKLNGYLFYFALSILFLIGLLDDKYKLNSIQKILPTIMLCGFFIIMQQTIKINDFLIFGYYLDLKSQNLAFIFTILSFFLFMNAFNMYDGINLQSATYSIFFFSNLYFINQTILFLIIIIYIIVFSFFNNSGKTFMGEAGCLLISFMLSIYCINLYNLNQISVEQIIILMIFPGLEILRLFCVRIINKKSPFKPDKNHLHHYLIKNFKQSKSTLYFIILYIIKTYLILNYSNAYSILALILLYCITIIYVKKKNYKLS